MYFKYKYKLQICILNMYFKYFYLKYYPAGVGQKQQSKQYIVLEQFASFYSKFQ